MPRPNRYHPYARPQITAPAVMSPRYPPPTSYRYPQPLPSISESTNPTTSSSKPSYQSIYPGYIRAVTTDGQPLITRSVYQDTNGMYHIQMEAIRYPSQCLPSSQSQSNANAPSTSHGTTQHKSPLHAAGAHLHNNPYAGMGLAAQQQHTLPSQIDPRFMMPTLPNVGVKRADSLIDGSSERGDGSEKSVDDECAIETGDEADDGDGDDDAEGDVDEEFRRVLNAQRRMGFQSLRVECAGRVF